MPKQIKLTDRVAEKLAQRAEEDNLSMAGEVGKLLEGGGGENSILNSTLDSIIGKLDYLENYIDKKFNELKALIEDTTVDRVSGGGGRSYQDPAVRRALARKDLEWEPVQELVYDFLDEKSPEWFPGAASAVRNMDIDVNCYIKDEVLYFENSITEESFPVLHVSPRVQEFLDTHEAN